MKNASIAILGAGSWGTAVAIHVANTGKRVHLWARNPQHAMDMSITHCNQTYLPNSLFPETLHPTSNLEECLAEATTVIIAVPSHAFSHLIDKIGQPKHGIAWLTKGIDPGTHHLLSELVSVRFGQSYPVAMITGPSFAGEVARALPTAVVIAGNDMPFQQRLHAILHHNNLRAYQSHDLTGVQICGAVKNILAIAAGISDGLHFGANAKAALITRGLAEMSRLGIHLGARIETFMGLAGVGDLVLTCTDDQSRNRRFGLQLGIGVDPATAEASIGQVVEGKHNAAQICALASSHQIEMPICEAVLEVLQGTKSPTDAVNELMRRPPRVEY